MRTAGRIAKVFAKLLLAAVVVFGFAAAMWGPSRVVGWLTGAATVATTEAREVRFYTARCQDLVISLSERGTLRATRNVKVGVPFGRRRHGGQATIAYRHRDHRLWRWLPPPSPQWDSRTGRW